MSAGHSDAAGNGAIEPVRVAVVGLGYWGPEPGRNLHELPEADLACVCDSRPEALAKLRSRYPAVPRRTNVRAASSPTSRSRRS